MTDLPQDTIKIHDTVYTVCSSQQVLDCLAAGKPVDGVYVDTLCLQALKQSKASIPLVIKNSIFKNIDFTQTTFEQEVYIENVEIQEKIDLHAHFNNGLHWKNCVIAPNVVLANSKWVSSLRFQDTVFHSEFALKNCCFQDNVNLTHCTFQQKFVVNKCEFAFLELQRSKFQNQLVFTDNICRRDLVAGFLEIDEHCQIRNCCFDGDAEFIFLQTSARLDCEQVYFSGKAKWKGSHFRHKFVVKECVFKNFASWIDAHFESHMALQKSRFETDVSFTNAVFEDQAFFDDSIFRNGTLQKTHFQSSVTFMRSQISGVFLWYGAQCDGDVIFDFSVLGERTSFSNVVFNSDLSFYRTTMKGPTWFLGTHFQTASFANATFEGQLFFSFDRNTLEERNRRRKGGPREQSLQFVSTFHGIANFTNAFFYRKTVFEKVFFKDFANFSNACFAEEINFEQAHFQEGATFKGSFCTQELNFTKAVFDNYVDFDLANINRRLNLTDATLEQGISFYHAVIDVVVVEREQIEGRLIYEGKIPGCEDKQHLMRAKEEFLILKESFQQRGKFDEEDWAYYCYRSNDRKSLTQKAWCSFFGKSILAVQDDVPEEERENPALLIKQKQKSLAKLQKKIMHHHNKCEELHNAIADSSLSKKNKTKKERELYRLQEDIAGKEKNLHALQQELQKLEAVIAMDQIRQNKLCESKDKPFTYLQAMRYILQNALWKCVDWGTGYGVKPFRIGLLAAVVILLFASIYFVSGAPYPGHNSHTSQLKAFCDWTYFSAMTFATSSPEGEKLAYNDRIKFFIMTEALLGVFLMALFVGCYARKIIR